jgi:hypothetical protein
VIPSQARIAIAILLSLCAIIDAVVSGAKAHEPYSDWKIPGTSSSCCNDRDCRPVRAAQDLDGNWTAFVDGREVRIPRDRILNMRSPDGRSHLCADPVGLVPYCFVPGDVRS